MLGFDERFFTSQRFSDYPMKPTLSCSEQNNNDNSLETNMVKVIKDEQRTIHRVPPSQIENFPANIHPNDPGRKRTMQGGSSQAPCQKRVLFWNTPSKEICRNEKKKPLSPVPKSQPVLDMWLTTSSKSQSFAKRSQDETKKTDMKQLRQSVSIDSAATSNGRLNNRDLNTNPTQQHPKHQQHQNGKIFPLKRAHSADIERSSKKVKYNINDSPSATNIPLVSVKTRIYNNNSFHGVRDGGSKCSKRVKYHTHKPVLSNKCGKCNNLYKSYQAGSCTEAITDCLRFPMPSARKISQLSKFENGSNSSANRDDRKTGGEPIRQNEIANVSQTKPLDSKAGEDAVAHKIQTPSQSHKSTISTKVKKIYRSEKALLARKRQKKSGMAPNKDQDSNVDLLDVGNQSPSISSTVYVMPSPDSTKNSYPIVLLKREDIIEKKFLSPYSIKGGLLYTVATDDSDVEIVTPENINHQSQIPPLDPAIYSNLSSAPYTNALKLTSERARSETAQIFRERENIQVQMLEESGFIRASIDTIDRYSSVTNQPGPLSKIYLMEECTMNTSENLSICQKASHVMDRLQKLSIQPRHRLVWHWDELFNVVKNFDLMTPVTDDNYSRKFVCLTRLQQMASAMEEDLERCRIESFVQKSIAASILSADTNLRNVLKMISWLPRAVKHCVAAGRDIGSSRKQKLRQTIYPGMLLVLQKLLHMSWAVSRNLSGSADRIACELLPLFSRMASCQQRWMFLETLQSHSIRMKLLQLYLDSPSRAAVAPRRMSLRLLVEFYFNSPVVVDNDRNGTDFGSESSTYSPEAFQEHVFFLYCLAQSYIKTHTGQLHVPLAYRKTCRIQLTDDDLLVYKNFEVEIAKLKDHIEEYCNGQVTPTTTHFLQQLELLNIGPGLPLH